MVGDGFLLFKATKLVVIYYSTHGAGRKECLYDYFFGSFAFDSERMTRSSKYPPFLLLLWAVVLGVEPRAWLMPGSCPTTQPHPQPIKIFF